jgi:uncharacterized protein YrrD
MKFSELKGRAVVSLDNATKLGTVEDLMIDPVHRHIVSLKIRTGVFSATRFVPAAEVKNVGADAVTVSVNAGLVDTMTNAAGAGQPDTAAPGTGAAGVASPATPVELTSILGLQVVTDAGTLVGNLHDVVFDWSNLTITGYEVRESGMFSKVQEFTATPDVRFGDKIITMPAALFSQPG